MASRMNSKQTTVINERLCRRAALEVDTDVDQETKEEESVAERKQREDDIQLDKVKKLTLSFKGICKIENLKIFSSLQKLCLDNNNIKKIENLSSMPNLTWLDLSFNSIARIEGLESLTKLTDLSLYHNEITEISGLDSCTKLNILSLGKNRIKSLNSLKSLRRFAHLQVVNFVGNPMCEDSDYKAFVLAYLKYLRYLDYELVESDKVVAAREQFQDFLQELEEKEGLEEKSNEMQRSQGDYLAKVKAANLHLVDSLIEDIFQDDTEHSKLICLPFMRGLVDAYQTKYSGLVDEFKQSALELNKSMEDERAAFAVAIQKARSSSIMSATALKKEFDRKLKRIRRDVMTGAIHLPALESTLADIAQLNDKLQMRLMGIESETRDDFDELSTHFEVRFGEMKDKLVGLYQKFFRATEDIENAHSEMLTNKTAELIERHKESDSDTIAVDENLAILLQDKESLMTSVLTSNDVHVGKMLAVEDEMRERLSKQSKSMLSDIHSQERDRNQAYVIEVGKLRETYVAEIAAIRSIARSREA